MRIGIIDLGTNSVRFAIHQFGPGRQIKLLFREKIMVRLGQGVFTNGQLDPGAIGRTVHAFHTFRKIADDLHVKRVIALGTSALREAVDSPRLVAKVLRSTGIDVRVISGPEEARLIALGILSNERLPKGKVGLIDIGGGSTEISITQNGQVLSAESFPLGTARLQQVFLKKSPPSPGSVPELRAYVRKTLVEKIEAQQWARPGALIGSSGTVRAVGKILKRLTGKKNIRLKDLKALNAKMQSMNTTQLLGIPGMEAKRVDMILAGSILLEECMRELNCDELASTEFSLRDGILEEQLKLSQQHMTTQIGLHLTDLVDRAARFGQHRRRLEAVTAMADKLFKGLSRVHKLDSEWRLYLIAAAILRNVGEAVSVVGNAEHSAYVVRHAKFPFFEDWETELVAELCHHHERQKLDLSLIPFAGARRAGFLKVLAMLCVIDALDLHPKSATVVERISAAGKSVKIAISGGTGTDLELYRLEQRRALFESLMKKQLGAQRV